jgi:hypothetical protein
VASGQPWAGRLELGHGLPFRRQPGWENAPVPINLPPRHLKSHPASVAFPAWCLGHEPGTQILCVSCAQELANKLSRDCRRIMASNWQWCSNARPPYHDWRVRLRLSTKARKTGRAAAAASALSV